MYGSIKIARNLILLGLGVGLGGVFVIGGSLGWWMAIAGGACLGMGVVKLLS